MKLIGSPDNLSALQTSAISRHVRYGLVNSSPLFQNSPRH